MSLSKQQIHFLVEELDPLIRNSYFKQFYHSHGDHYILNLQNSQNEYTMLLCFRNPFVRFHLIPHPLKGMVDPLSSAISKQLEGSKLEKIETVNDDRIVQWVFSKGKHRLFLLVEFFSKKPNLYLLGPDNFILAVLNPTSTQHYLLPEKPSRPSLQQSLNTKCLSSPQIDKLYRELERNAAFQKEMNSTVEYIKQKLKRAHKKYVECHEQLKLANDWQTIHHEAELLLSNMYRWNLGMDKIIIQDWESDGKELSISLDPVVPLSTEIAARFRKGKKLKASIPYLKSQLSKIEGNKAEYESFLVQIKDIVTLEQLNEFKKLHGFSKQSEIAKEEVLEKRAKPYFEYWSASNLSIWVGKSAKDNEKLTFSLSKGSDWWLHVQGVPGSHIILRSPKNIEPDPEALKDAVQLALAYSKAKDKGEAEVIVTQRKYISRFGKGQPGKVQVSKHKVIKAKFDATRFQQIKQRGKAKDEG